MEDKQTHQNTGGKLISSHAQILRSAFGGRGMIQNLLDAVQRSSGWQIEIKDRRSATRHSEIIQLTPEDPVIRKTAGNRARKKGPEKERRQTLERGRWQKRLRQREQERRGIEKRICGVRADYWQRTTKTEDAQLISTWTEFHGSTLKNWQRRQGPDEFSAGEMRSDRWITPSDPSPQPRSAASQTGCGNVRKQT